MTSKIIHCHTPHDLYPSFAVVTEAVLVDESDVDPGWLAQARETGQSMCQFVDTIDRFVKHREMGPSVIIQDDYTCIHIYVYIKNNQLSHY